MNTSTVFADERHSRPLLLNAKKDGIIPLVDTNCFLQGDLGGVIHELLGGEFKEQKR